MFLFYKNLPLFLFLPRGYPCSSSDGTGSASRVSRWTLVPPQWAWAGSCRRLGTRAWAGSCRSPTGSEADTACLRHHGAVVLQPQGTTLSPLRSGTPIRMLPRSSGSWRPVPEPRLLTCYTSAPPRGSASRQRPRQCWCLRPRHVVLRVRAC